MSRRALLALAMDGEAREGVHFTIRPYDQVCTQCDRRFKQPSTLKVHMPCLDKRLIHEREDIDRYECYKCGKAFKSLNHLRQHVTFHLQRMFQCLLCGAEHFTKQQVQRHVICEHQHVKAYRCHRCSKSYTEKRQLIRHWTRTGHGIHAAIGESVSCVSEDSLLDSLDDGCDSLAPANAGPLEVATCQSSASDDEVLLLVPRETTAPSHGTEEQEAEGTRPAVCATKATAADATAIVAQTSDEDQLTDFINFQRFLSMMRHCDRCDGYFMSDALLEAHLRVHSTDSPAAIEGKLHQEPS